MTLRICAFESRRAEEMRSLIERHGARATIAPSMRELPLDQNPEAFRFAEELLAGRIDVVVFLTGVGAQALLDVLETRHPREAILRALDARTIVVRGPKPVVVLRGWGVHIDHRAPEPNTWRELLATLEQSVPLKGARLALQEYGAPSVELLAELERRGADVLRVPVYRWDLPADLGPLTDAIRATTSGAHEILLFTSAQQIHHVLRVAGDLGLRNSWLDAANRRFVGSIGPTCSDALRGEGLRVDFEATPPKMGHLVKGAIEATRTRGDVTE